MAIYSCTSDVSHWELSVIHHTLHLISMWQHQNSVWEEKVTQIPLMHNLWYSQSLENEVLSSIKKIQGGTQAVAEGCVACSSLGTAQGPWKAVNNWNCPPPQHCSIIFPMNIKWMKLSWQGATSCNSVYLLSQPCQTELLNAGAAQSQVTLLTSLEKEWLYQTS